MEKSPRKSLNVQVSDGQNSTTIINNSKTMEKSEFGDDDSDLCLDLFQRNKIEFFMKLDETEVHHYTPVSTKHASAFWDKHTVFYSSITLRKEEPEEEPSLSYAV